jgi:predicted PurR-regulated permease PerM
MLEAASGFIGGLIKLLLLDWVFDWLQERFGFGRARSCIGCLLGVILLLVFAALACAIVTNTDWTRLATHTSNWFL